LTPQQQSAFNDALLSGIQDKDMDVIRLALDNGAEPNLLMFAGMDYKSSWKDAFNAAAGTKGFAYEWVKMAVEAGADTKATKLGGDKKGWAAMHWAFLNFNSDIIDYLVEKGESIDTPSPYNDTPLMRAIDDGKADQIRYFLGKGADPMCACGK